MAFEKVASLKNLWEGEMLGITFREQNVLLVRTKKSVLAYQDRCSHLGVRLSKGLLEDGHIVCCAHRWAYEAATGQGINPQSAQLKKYDVRIEGEDIFVDLDREVGVDIESIENFENRVGPVLQSGPLANAVSSAIRALNDNVQIIDRGAYIRILVPKACIVTQEKIEEFSGHKILLPGDLESIMTSFKGKLTVSERTAEWKFDS